MVIEDLLTLGGAHLNNKAACHFGKIDIKMTFGVGLHVKGKAETGIDDLGAIGGDYYIILAGPVIKWILATLAKDLILYKKSFEITGLHSDNGHWFLVFFDGLGVKKFSDFFFNGGKKPLERLSGSNLPDYDIWGRRCVSLVETKWTLFKRDIHLIIRLQSIEPRKKIVGRYELHSPSQKPKKAFHFILFLPYTLGLKPQQPCHEMQRFK
ncbi:MAG: hypothetical protein JSU60_05030 [Nitrospirota bacterium]|nr:MAG: hypothetical protein JSU60_05030 [Nitrospirota bacterium]